MNFFFKKKIFNELFRYVIKSLLFYIKNKTLIDDGKFNKYLLILLFKLS